MIVKVRVLIGEMASRIKEDEKNERTIRSLLKLPDNRRCINCNSLVCYLFLPSLNFLLFRWLIFLCLLAV